MQLFDADELMLTFPELADAAQAGRSFKTDPTRDVAAGEQVVGTVEREFTRQLWGFFQFYARRMAEERLRSEFGNTLHERMEAAENVNRSHLAGEALKGLLFLAIRDELGERTHPSSGVRSDWKIVVLAPSPQMPEFLKGLFQGSEE